MGDLIGDLIKQTFLTFASLQLVFGYIASRYRMDIFYILGELFKGKYLGPSFAVTGIVLVINIMLRFLVWLFS